MASQRSLSSRLTIRLFWIAIFISILLSTGAFMAERNALGDVAGDRAVLNAARFNTQYLDLIDRGVKRHRTELQKAVEEYTAATRNVQSTIGRFVAIRLYAEDGTLVAKLDDENHPKIELINQLLNAGIGLVDGTPGQLQQGVRIDGVPHVRVYLPLIDSNGRKALFADLIFALSDESFAFLRNRTFKMLIAVFMIVMTTTMILSPALFSLVNEEEKKSAQA
jgi:hypothetical protein